MMPNTPATFVAPRRGSTPVIYLSVDGKPADDLVRRLLSFDYKKSTKKASETKITFQNDVKQASGPGTWPYAVAFGDDPRFHANTIWRFRFGYHGNMSPIHVGILRSLTPTYAAERNITITLFDHSSKLGKSSSGKNWGRVESAVIARKIAAKYGLDAVVETSEDIPERAFIQPGDVSDLQYLRDLAADINYECFTHDSPPTLVYRSTQYDTPAHFDVFYYGHGEGGFVKSFMPKLKNLGEIKTQAAKAQGKKKDGGKTKGSVVHSSGKGAARQTETLGGPSARYHEFGQGQQQVAFVNANTGEAVAIPKGAAATLYNSVAGATVVVGGAIIGKKNVGEEKFFDQLASEHAVSKAAASGANTRRLAASQRQQLLDKAEEASSDHPLIPRMEVGKPYTWAGLDQQLNGQWYCTEVGHRISGTEISSKAKWKRDDPKEKKGGKKGAGGSTSGSTAQEGNSAGRQDQVVIKDSGKGVRPQETIRARPAVATTKPPPKTDYTDTPLGVF